MISFLINTGEIYNERATRLYVTALYTLLFIQIDDELYEYEKVLWYILAVLPIWISISIIKANSFPNLFRAMSGSGRVDNSVYYRMGVLGYDYIYSVSTVFPALLGLFKRRRGIGTLKTIIVVLNIVLNVILIYMANYGIAFFSLLISIICYILFRETTKKHSVILFSTVLLVGFFVYYNLDKIVLFLMRILENTYYITKLQPIYESLIYNQTFGRMDIWGNALTLFIHHPILGAGYNNITGAHSEVLTLLAQLGIFGGGAGVLMLYAPYYQMMNSFGLQRKVAMSSMVAYIMVTVFNPTGLTLPVIAYCVLRISLKTVLSNDDIYT